MSAARRERIREVLLGLVGWGIVIACWQWCPEILCLAILAGVLRLVVQHHQGGGPCP